VLSSFKKNLKQVFKNSTVVDLLIILLLGCLSLTWFRGDNFITGGDFDFPLNLSKYLKIILSLWEESSSFGYPAYRQLTGLFPFGILGGIFHLLGLSALSYEKFLFYLWFAGGGTSMYFLCSVLKMSRLGKLMASLFYMLNPFSMMVIWRISQGSFQMPYAFSPLCLGFYLKGLKEKRGLSYIVTVLIAWGLLTTTAYANPRSFIVHWSLIFIFFLSLFFSEKQNRAFVVRYSAIFVGLWLAFNAYWLLPQAWSVKESFTAAHLPTVMSDIDSFKLNSAKIVEAIRLFGLWSLHSGYKGEPYYPYENYYNSPIIKIFSFLIPIIVFLGFLNPEVKKKPLFYFCLTVIVLGLVGISGANPPFGGILVWIYQKLPLLNLITRANFLFFGMILAPVFAVLLGYGFLMLHQWLFRKVGNFVYLLFSAAWLALFVFLVFPFWNGEVIRSKSKVLAGERLKIPEYWEDVWEYINLDEKFSRILPLPMTKTYHLAFNWEEGYSGPDLSRWLIDKPTVSVNTGETYKLAEIVGGLIERRTNLQQVFKILGLMNIKYLVFSKDTNWDLIRGHNWWFAHTQNNIESFLLNQKEITLKKKFGEIDVFTIPEDYVLPQVFVSDKIIGIDGEIEAIAEVTEFLNASEKNSLIFKNQNASNLGLDRFDDYYTWKGSSFVQVDGKIDFQKVVYEFSVPQAGGYDVFICDDDFKKYYQSDKDILPLYLDDQPLEGKAFTSYGDNLINLGKIELGEGSHRIIIVLPKAINLIPNNSFEKGLWEGAVNPFSPLLSKAEDQVSVFPDAFEGKNSLRLTATRQSVAVFQPISHSRPGDIYKISFSVKNLKGKPVSFVIWENSEDSLSPNFNPIISNRFGISNLPTAFSSTLLPLSSSWKSYEINFRSNPGFERIGIAFLAEDGLGQDVLNLQTEALIDGVSVERVFTNPLLLRYVGPENKGSLPSITSNKINSSFYEVEVKNAKEPYFLVLSEAFHPGWTISAPAQHLMVNGFANGWYLNKKGNYKIIIQFKPMAIYGVGIFISISTLLSAGIYLLISHFKPLKPRLPFKPKRL